MAQSPPARAKVAVREGGLRAFLARGFNRRGPNGLCLFDKVHQRGSYG
jgi:hypothetical protein